MLRIKRFLSSEAVEHKLKVKHDITLDEIESVNKAEPIFLRYKDLYIMLGRTEFGRYLFVLLRYLGGGAARIVTAHEMTGREKRAFQRFGG